MMRRVGLVLAALSLVAGNALGAAPKPFRWLVQTAGEYHYVQDGAAFGRGFGDAWVGNLSVGAKPWSFLYVGTRFDYWVGGTADKLDLHTLGLELAYTFGNPRVFWMIGGGASFPLKAAVQSGGNVFEKSPPDFLFHGKLTLGLRMSPAFALLAFGGYRLASLGELSSLGSPYLAGGLDLTGAFGGLGLGVTF